MKDQVVKELWVNDRYVGIIHDIEITRDAVEEASDSVHRNFKPGPVARVCVTLVKGPDDV
jgi:hypothetical protein